MNIGFYQFNPLFGKVKENVEKVYKKIKNCKADLIVLPELFNTGYLFLSKDEVASLSEKIPEGYTTQKLIALARRKKIYLVAGIAEREKNKFYNSAILVGPGGHIATYRKAHLFHEEKYYFSPGNIPFRVHDIGIARIGIIICFDWYFPEASRRLALKGAEIICQPANLVLPDCPQAMITRSLENRIFSITANRTGTEKRGGKKLTYIGNSQIVNPKGKIIVRTGRKEEKLVIAKINPKEARDKTIFGINHLFKDRRPDLYS